jgi:LacI family transcriptional regulator
MSKKTTIYDIANKLNITAATVSRALNNNPRISAETKKLVLETAASMNYKQNRLALALKSGKSKNVGVVVPYINGYFFSSIIRGIEDELYPKGYHVIITQTHDDQKREVKNIQNLLNAQVDGILISTSHSNKELEHFESVLKKNVPFIFFDRKLNIPDISSVIIDDYQGGYDATQHLIDQGCNRIAHLKVNNGLELYQKRLQGYKDALLQNGLEYNAEYVIPLKSDMKAGKEAAEQLMKLPLKPDAIFSSTDNGLLGAMKYIQSIGTTVPDDFCVVGFSNEPFTQYMDPSISSVDQSPVEMGKMAAKVFLEQIENGDNIKVHKNVVLPAKLIIRKSSTKS